MSSVACAWFGLLPKGCQSRVGSQRGTNRVEHWRRTYVIDRPELLLGLISVRGHPPPITEARRAIPLGYDPPANGQSVLALSFRGRERAEFQLGLQPGRCQTRPLTEARLLILTTEGPRRLPQHYER